MKFFKPKRHSSNQQPVSFAYYVWILFRLKIRKIRQKIANFQSRRFHRSFHLTRRRDYVRKTDLPGYFGFNKLVFGLIFKNWRIFLKAICLFSFASLLLVGLMSQEFLSDIWELMDKTNKSAGGVFSGFFGEVGKAGLLVFSAMTTGGLTPNLNENQVLILAVIVLLEWLVVVQICRNLLVGRNDGRLRDALYTAGAPIVNLAAISVIILVQALPIFIAVIVWSAAQLTNLFEIGVEQMMFSVAGLLLVCASTYWIVGSFFALIISTVSQAGKPIYPIQAIRIAGDMVVSRRLLILRRIIWMILTAVFWWMVVFVPMFLIVNFLGGKIEIIKKIPIIQFAMLIMSSSTVVFFAAYTYILYRKIIENDQR